MITKKASLDCKEGVSSHRRNAFFKLRRGSRQIERVPHSRDRRPRLSAFLPFRDTLLGNIPSFGGAWGGFLFAVLWRTDEGVCPYVVASLWIERTIQIGYR